MRSSLRALAVVLAAASTATPRTASADVVVDWNTTIISLTAAGPAPVQYRALASAHVAMHDAVNAVERRYTPLVADLKAPAGASIDAAAAAAAHGVLSALLPQHKPALDAAFDASLAKVPEGAPRKDGVAVGHEVAEKVVAMCAKDGFTAKVDVKPVPVAKGAWQLTPGFKEPLITQWGQMKPMVVKTLADFDLGPPAPPASPQFARDYEEIKAVGAARSTTRTADQTAVAIFWAGPTMSPWNAAAQAAARARKLSFGQSGDVEDLYRHFGIDAAMVVDAAIDLLEARRR